MNFIAKIFAKFINSELLCLDIINFVIKDFGIYLKSY